VQKLFHELLLQIGEDPTRPGLAKTPQRAATAFQYLTQGYQDSLEDMLKDGVFPTTNGDMVIVRNIQLFSLCEHHLLPFTGLCHVAYRPKELLMGLSKVARVVDMYARRLQLQEQLTQQIAEAISQITQAEGVGVVIEAKHLCTMTRGVEKHNAVMTTSVMLGSFQREPSIRAEFINLLQSNSQL
jgi:GTP cyclohydrolase IA